MAVFMFNEFNKILIGYKWITDIPNSYESCVGQYNNALFATSLKKTPFTNNLLTINIQVYYID
jgi:hypothetical protein